MWEGLGLLRLSILCFTDKHCLPVFSLKNTWNLPFMKEYGVILSLLMLQGRVTLAQIGPWPSQEVWLRAFGQEYSVSLSLIEAHSAFVPSCCFGLGAHRIVIPGSCHRGIYKALRFVQKYRLLGSMLMSDGFSSLCITIRFFVTLSNFIVRRYFRWEYFSDLFLAH